MNLQDILKNRILESDDDDNWEANQAKGDELVKKFIKGFEAHTRGMIKIPNAFGFFHTWLFGGGPLLGDDDEVANSIVNGYLKEALDYDYEDPGEDGLLKLFKAFGLTRGEFEWFMDNIG
jgi:hypothetical protein